MTLKEIAIEVFENAGEVSYLNPYNPEHSRDEANVDLTTAKGQKLVRIINMAYERICSWRNPKGNITRFPQLYGELYFTTAFVEGTAQGGGSSTVTLASEASTTDDFYNGWVIEAEGQTRLIVDYVGSTRVATVHTAWDTEPDSTSAYELYKQGMEMVDPTDEKADYHIPMDPVDSMWVPVKLTDLKTGSNLGPGGREVNYSSNFLSPAIPTSYTMYGNKLVFSHPVAEARTYKLEFMRMPGELSDPEDEPQIPEPVHLAIILMANWYILKKEQEYGDAYAMRRDLEDLMATTVSAEEWSHERDSGQLYPDL